MIATGQLILGTDKRNALFTVYEWEEDDGEEQLHVYYGLELLEVVSADRNAPSFRMLVGRLYNAGLSRRVLQETFKVDLKTNQRWQQRYAVVMAKNWCGCWPDVGPGAS